MTAQELIQALTEELAPRIRELCADDKMDCDHLCAGNILTAKCIVFQAADRIAALQAENAEKDKKIERLSALVKAQDEGRVHIDPPPAKEGDPKPSCFYEDGASLWCLGLSHEGDDEPIDRCKQCWYCENGDYADDRAEAEAALSGGGGDD